MVRSLFETNSACAWQTEGNIFGIKYLGWILNGQKVISKMCENPKAVANKFSSILYILPYYKTSCLLFQHDNLIPICFGKGSR